MHHLHQAIGLFGGTFDPIHFGHLRTAIELKQALDLAHIRLIPCFQPVHRKQPIASPLARLEMVKTAIESESALVCDDLEIKRQGPSYTIETLIELHQTFPQTPLCLIMGIDALLNFPSWHRWEEILDLAHLVIAHRPNYQLPQSGIVANLLTDRRHKDVSSIHKKSAGVIILHPVTPLDISATDIRKQLVSGLNPRYLLPNNVLQHIQQHGTYGINSTTTL